MENKHSDQVFPAEPCYCCVALIESCFMRCKMCYKWKNSVSEPHPDEPSLEQWRKFFFDLSKLCRNQIQINFAGGEPLCREETLPLMAYAKERGFDTLLATNAYLINEDTARKIGRSGVSAVSISLDSLDEKVHDYLRGRGGSFARVMRAFKLLREFSPRTRIYLCSILSAINISGAADLLTWANAQEEISGIFFQAITQPFNTPEEKTWQDNPEYAALWPSDLDLTQEALERIIAMAQAKNFRPGFHLGNSVPQLRMFKRYFADPGNFIKTDKCHLDERAINITPAGDVRLCFYQPSIGNIKSASILDIWKSEEADNVRGKIGKCRKNCQSLVNCNFEEDKNDVG